MILVVVLLILVYRAPLLPLLAGARAEDPFRAAWWSSIAINTLIAFWMVALVLKL